MRILNAKGEPLGISFMRHKQNNGYVIRVSGNGAQTDFGVTPDNIATCFEKAIDRRLEMLGIPEDAEAWQILASAYGAFLARYNIEIKQVVINEFDIKGECK